MKVSICCYLFANTQQNERKGEKEDEEKKGKGRRKKRKKRKKRRRGRKRERGVGRQRRKMGRRTEQTDHPLCGPCPWEIICDASNLPVH